MLHDASYRQFDFAEMEKIARSLAEQNQFANPYKIDTGPTAHHAPVYPFLLSLVFRAFGYGATARMAQVSMNLVFISVALSLLPLLARNGGLPGATGIIAGVAAALLPIRFQKELRWEATLAALAVVFFIWLWITLLRGQTASKLAVFGAGAGAGLCVLTSVALLPVAVALTIGYGVRRSWRRAALTAAGIVAALLPWTVRNYVRLGGLVPVRSNGPLEISQSFYDGVYPDVQHNEQVNFPNNQYHLRHPWSSEIEAQKVKQSGEIAYGRARLSEAEAWISAHRGETARLIAERFRESWFPPYPGSQVYKCVLTAPLTVYALAGLIVMLRRATDAALPFAALWLLFPAVNYVVQSDTRFRYPLDWTEWFLCSYFFCQFAATLHSRLRSVHHGDNGSRTDERYQTAGNQHRPEGQPV